MINKKIKIISIFFTGFLLFETSLFYPSNVQTVMAQENKLEEQIEEDIVNELPSEIEVEDVDFSIVTQEVNVQATNNDESISINFDLNSDSALSLSEDALTMTSKSQEEDSQEYSLFFGTIDQKELYDNAIQKDEALLESISAQLEETPVEVLSEIELGANNIQEVDDSSELNQIESNLLESEKLIESGELVLSSVEELEDSSVVVTNLKTNESFEVNQTDGVATFAFAIPAGIAITTAVGKTLIAAGAAIIVGGGIALSLDKISTNSKTRNNNFNHFKVLRVNSKLYSTGGVSQKSAIARMMLGADVWSNSQSGAKTVASSTSLNLGGSKTPIGPERDKNKSGYYRHYHTNPRKKSGGHSFYGGPA